MNGKRSHNVCKVVMLGTLPYMECWKLQQEIATVRRNGEGGDMLLLVEHLPVYTMGRSGSKNNIKVSLEMLQSKGLEVVEVDRGGDITFHGPGQLVGYPILDLRGYKQDLHYYAAMLEEIIIRTLAQYGISGFREPGLTGVWTAGGKIAAIGIGVRGWVTMHGFALNVHPEMNYFKYINPCGITDRPVVSMKELGVDAAMADVGETLIEQFADVFGVSLSMVRAGQKETEAICRYGG